MALGEEATRLSPHEEAVPDRAGEVARLYETARRDLVKLAVFLTDDWALAEELVQDAFESVYRRWESLTSRDAAIGYLRVCVVNGARSAHRRKVVARRHLKVAEPDSGPAADYALLISEEHRRVIAAMKSLPRRQREVLVLRYWGGLSEGEIAESMGISRGTVKSTGARALDAVTRLLQEAP